MFTHTVLVCVIQLTKEKPQEIAATTTTLELQTWKRPYGLSTVLVKEG